MAAPGGGEVAPGPFRCLLADEHGFDTFFGVAYSNDMQPFDLYEQKTIIEAPADQKALKRHVLKWNQRAASSPCFVALPNGRTGAHFT